MRAAIYSRVSSEEQVDGYSLDAQEHAAGQLAALRGWQVTRTYREPGRSGKSALRPEFQQMIADAERRAFDVVIVHKLDRFSRSLVDILQYLQRLDKAGVAFVSVSESFDFSTASGRLFLTMLGAFAEWYLANLADEIRKGKRERARQGGWNGQLSWGYTTPARLQAALLALGDGYKAGQLVEDEYARLAGLYEDALEMYGQRAATAAIPDPVNAPGVRLMFESYAVGTMSDRDIARLLNDAGYKAAGRAGRSWFGKETIADMLQNRFYIGETSYGARVPGHERQFIQGEHEPLVSRELFQRVQDVRARRSEFTRTVAQRRERTRCYPLSGVLRCLCCGERLRGHKVRSVARYHSDGTTCPRGGMLVADDVEAQVGALIGALELPDDWRARALARSGQTKPTGGSIAGKLKRLQEVYIDGFMPRAEYEAKRDALMAQMEPSPVASDALEQVAALLGSMQRLWDAATLEERQMCVQMLFKSIYVSDGRIKAAEPTGLLWALLDGYEGSIRQTGRTGALHVWRIIRPATPLEEVQRLVA